MVIKKLGELLVEQGVLRADQLAYALEEHARRGVRLGDLLIELEYATERQVTAALASQAGVESADLDKIQPDLDAISLVPGSLAWRHRCVPIALDAKEGTIAIALARPQDAVALGDIELATRHFVQPVLAAAAQIEAWLERWYASERPQAPAAVAGPGPGPAPTRKKRVGELLIEAQVVDETQLAIALAEQKRVGGHIGQILVNLGLASEEAVSRALASQSGVEHLSLDRFEPDPRVVAIVPESVARQHQLAPLSVDMETGVLSVAMVNPGDIVAIDELEMTTSLYVQAARASERQISRFLDRAYRARVPGGVEDSSLEELIRQAIAELDQRQTVPGRGSIVQLVDELIGGAIRREATDLHFEPSPNVIRVRYRSDGDLVQGQTLSAALLSSIVARIKIMADLDIATTRVPQDGKIHFPFENRRVDLRVSTFPALYGESVVIRVLDKNKAQFTLESLGLDAREQSILRSVAQRPNGLVLAVGPTGSGKTTTLYATLRQMNSSTRKVITLEDPVEYEMSLVTQCQINEKAGITFANGLRSILRHDPDIILVGEMRDAETTRMALRAALTGHLVLSTLHANDAVRALSRLRDMGMESYLIASCLVAVCAQRLVRLVCELCRKPHPATAAELELLGLAAGEKVAFVRGEGCSRCNGTGMRGRKALFEVLEVTPEISQLMAREAPLDAIAEAARRGGMVPFRGNAQRLAREGAITVEEAARVSVEG
jgi:type IV pilus assembly protein PilB